MVRAVLAKFANIELNTIWSLQFKKYRDSLDNISSISVISFLPSVQKMMSLQYK